MFDKKLVNVLCWILAVLLVLQAALTVVLFVWGYFSPPQIDPSLGKIIQTVAGLGQVVFVYVVVATLKHLTVGGKK